MDMSEMEMRPGHKRIARYEGGLPCVLHFNCATERVLVVAQTASGDWAALLIDIDGDVWTSRSKMIEHASILTVEREFDMTAGSHVVSVRPAQGSNFVDPVLVEHSWRRALAENLDEEQLALYDLLMRPAPDLTDAERNQVKKVAESLLDVLKHEKLVLDWRKEQQSRAAVRLAVEMKLDELPAKYDGDLFQQKCEIVYLHVFDSYWDDGRSIYTTSRLAG